MAYAAIAGAVVSIAGQFMNISGSRSAQKKAQKAADRRRRALREQAEANLRQAAITTRVQRYEQLSQIGAEMADSTERAIQAIGQSEVSFAGRGVSGRTAAEVGLDITTEAGEERARLQKFQDFRDSAAFHKLRSLKIETEARLAANMPGPSFDHNNWVAGLEIVSAGLSGAAAGQQFADSLGIGTSSDQ